MENIRPIQDNEYFANLLMYIKSNADIRPFLNASDNDIVRFNRAIEAFFKDGIIARKENILCLTEKGESLFRSLNKKLGRRGVYAYFLPDYSKKKRAMKKTDLYIPQYMNSGGEGLFSSSYIYYY